ncbi:MAG: M48 family metalloprotease, partial [Planctomycetota bacterium]
MIKRAGDRVRLGLAVVLAGVLMLPVMGGCTTNPATGRSYYNAYSREEEIALGEQAAPQLAGEFGGAVPSATLQRYVSEVGGVLAAQTEADYPTLPWEFTLLDSEVINAFALPGGKVFITRGLASRFTNEAQLASVLGHEVGHVTGQHIDESVGRQTGLSIAAVLAGVGAAILAGDNAGTQALAGAGAAGAVQLLGLGALKFDRDQEIEADDLGIRYMTRAGYNPIGSLEGMQVLADMATEQGGRSPEILSTHPDPRRRVDIIRDTLEEEFPQALREPNRDVFAERFEADFLEPLSRLAPPSDQARAGRRGIGAFAWADTHAWCS